jgi:SAM-dependent methyltransferase
MSNPRYVIAGGAAGRERLRLLSEVMEPYTRELIGWAGVGPGARCLDAGCGGGEVSYLLAEAVGPTGSVLGVDLDREQLAIVQEEAAGLGVGNVSFACHDLATWEPDESFDFVHARFILSHLADPAGGLARLVRHLRPGGWIMVEDIDYRGHFCEPDCPALWRAVELYTEAVRQRGADANIGPRLPGLLRQVGLEEVAMHVHAPARMAPGGIKELVALTALRIAETAVGDGLESEEAMAHLTDELFAFARDPDTVLAGPRICQAWGTRRI